MTIDLIPATPVEAAVQDLRIAQAKYDEAQEHYSQLNIAVAEARVRRDDSAVELDAARSNLITAAVKPVQYVTEPVRVAPSYITEGQATEAAWSDKESTDN